MTRGIAKEAVEIMSQDNQQHLLAIQDVTPIAKQQIARAQTKLAPLNLCHFDCI